MFQMMEYKCTRWLCVSDDGVKMYKVVVCFR